jgi:phosphotriesterase-related protein
MPSDFAGQILTVTGPIEPGDLGVTMAHEHVLLFLQNNPTIELGDLARESDHVNLYARTDGNTLLSMSNYGLRWDCPGAPQPPFAPTTFVEAMRRVSIDGGAAIVLGTGFYKQEWQRPDVLAMSVEDLEQRMVADIVEGIEVPDGEPVRAGVIGEVGISTSTGDDLTDFEKRSLEASCRAALRTGAAINFHTQIGSTWRIRKRVLDLCGSFEMPLDRVMISHLRPQVRPADADAPSDPDTDDFLQSQLVMDRGALCSFDLIGHYGYQSADDQNAAYSIADLLNLNPEYLQQIVLSQDIFSDAAFFAQCIGYQYTTLNFCWMLNKAGVTADQIEKMRVNNLQRVLPLAV